MPKIMSQHNLAPPEDQTTNPWITNWIHSLLRKTDELLYTIVFLILEFSSLTLTMDWSKFKNKKSPLRKISLVRIIPCGLETAGYWYAFIF
jgi:hypothetical protein